MPLVTSTNLQEQSGVSFRSILGIPPCSPSPSDTTLLIIDAQNEYAHGALAIHDLKSSRVVIADLLQRWRDQKGNVVHVRHKTPEGAPIFTSGTDLVDPFAELTEQSDEKVIWKGAPSAFTSTGLDDVLKKGGIKKILLVGYMAHVCISGTSRAAAELGYEVAIVRDGIGDRDIPGVGASELVKIVCAELGDVSATIVESKDLRESKE